MSAMLMHGSPGVGGASLATSDASYTPRIQAPWLTTPVQTARSKTPCSSPQPLRATRLTHPLPGPSRYHQGRGSSRQAPQTRAASMCVPATYGESPRAQYQRLGLDYPLRGASVQAPPGPGAIRFKSLPSTSSSSRESATSFFTKRKASISFVSEPQTARPSLSFTPLASPSSVLAGSPSFAETEPDLRLGTWQEEFVWESARRSKSVCENLEKFQPPEFEYPLPIPESPDSLIESSRVHNFTEWPVGNGNIDFGKLASMPSDAERDTASEMGEGVVESSCTSTVWGDIGDTDDRNLVCADVVDIPSHGVVEMSESFSLPMEASIAEKHDRTETTLPTTADESSEVQDIISPICHSTVDDDAKHEMEMESGFETIVSYSESIADITDHEISVNIPCVPVNIPCAPLQICTALEIEPLSCSVRSAWTPAWSVLETPMSCSDAASTRFGQWPDSRRVSDVSDFNPGMRGLARLNLPPIQLAESEVASSLALLGNISPSTTCNYSDSDSDEDAVFEASGNAPQSSPPGAPSTPLTIEIPTPSRDRTYTAIRDCPTVAMTFGTDCSSFLSPYGYSPCSPPATCKYTYGNISPVVDEVRATSPKQSPSNANTSASQKEPAHFVFPLTSLPPQRPVKRDGMKLRPTKGQCKEAVASAAKARNNSVHKV